MTGVSVIIPTFNSSKYLEETLRSVLSQTYNDYEIIIIDGGSTDGTLNIVKNLQQSHATIKLINNKNDQGPAHSRLVGIQNATGTFVAFLDSDDLWDSNKLELQVQSMLRNSLDFTFTDYRKMTDEGVILPGIISGHDKNNFRQYLGRRGIANSTVMIRRSVIGDIWDGKISKSHGEDTLWWLLLMKFSGVSAIRIPNCLAIYRIAANGLSRKVIKNQLTVWDSYTRDLGLGKPAALFYYVSYIFDVAKRRVKYRILQILS